MDLSGKMPFADAKKIMKPRAVYVNVVPGPKQIIGSFIHNLFSAKKYKVMMLKPAVSYLETLAQFAAEGKDILVEKTYPMASYKEAYLATQKGKVLGKVVFTVGY